MKKRLKNTNNMKTIKQQIEEKAKEVYLDSDPFAWASAFKEGANFALELANKWVSVEEELPEENTVILVKNTYDILTGKRTGSYFIDIGNRTIGKVTHWRPIEQN